MSQHAAPRPRRADNQAGAQRQNERQNPGPNRPNRVPDPDRSEDEQLPDDDAPVEEWKEVATQLMLKSNEQKRQLAERARGPNRPENTGGEDRPEQPDRQTELESLNERYKNAGKRCCLMQMIWITHSLYDLEPNPDYLPALRYDKLKPGMALQGELQDMLNSMALNLRPGFLKHPKFQRVVRSGVSEERHNLAKRVRGKLASQSFGCKQSEITCEWEHRMANKTFQELLGFKSDGKSPAERYPCLAPVLYQNSRTGSNTRLFRSNYIYNTFSVCAFGETSLLQGIDHHSGQPVISTILDLNSITPGVIAAAATLTRWAISPDSEFKQKGGNTGVEWIGDYRHYKMLIQEGLRLEEAKFERIHTPGPFMMLMREWNHKFFPHSDKDAREDGAREEVESAPTDVEAALAQIHEFADDTNEGAEGGGD
ncbi:hypothetical protein FRC08_012259 [Ceratobasidium sp. 394]|nr:hypothetical protein FRC08_012259 [Ceratobasidium sp. 394]